MVQPEAFSIRTCSTAEVLRANDESVAVDLRAGAKRHTRLGHSGCAEKLQDSATIH